MGKRDNKHRALGDDPLAWLSAGTNAAKKPGKKKASSKKKPEKRSAPEKSGDKESLVSAEVKIEASKRLVLESSLVINNANGFYESLKELAAGEQTIEIDASKVEIIDSAILQLLVAFVLDLSEKDIPLSWHQPSENLLNKASILGLTEKLGL
ncbi:MAG: STAS domain-containing protein [Gammaproteobacteria bacterium]|nr:STAS domain-containing protein [Gammaproteobacteria bacterium]